MGKGEIRKRTRPNEYHFNKTKRRSNEKTKHSTSRKTIPIHQKNNITENKRSKSQFPSKNGLYYPYKADNPYSKHGLATDHDA
ncbi:hypothetical protein FUAX_45840 (plasmid) [Fulvitalea axinellae]|uniref:Uncharacterized protein n=1 Tax=Fulvitalea axinellae TaxID=1182444 RepID=A0AAU9CYW2_9BACT|nr:hypothetical protein FUAX_45840 [Fulvitalea axinellae]